MKLKDKIRHKLIKFLLIDEVEKHCIEETKNVKRELDKEILHLNSGCDNLFQSIRQIDANVKNNKESIDILHNTIRNVVSVGADVIPYENNRSWAVVCIEGNYNLVKFIDLHGADYRQILNFLKQYEGSRMVVDAPNPRYFESMFKF
jgi:hypothetical protein